MLPTMRALRIVFASKCLLAAGLAAGMSRVSAQQPTNAPTQASVAADAQAQAQAAVALVAKQFTTNPTVSVADTKKPLPKNGTWGVRLAQATEHVAECDAEGAVCREVLYHSGQPEIVCGWTVLFPADGSAARVVNVNDATAAYMLRSFTTKDKDMPKKISGSAPQMPPIARVAHLTGNVVLRVVVDATGKVQDLSIESVSNQMFSNYALDAVRTWKMETFTLNGRVLPYQEMVSVFFM